MKQVVLIENDINTRPFSTQVLACLPSLPWSLSPEDLANPNRQDLREVRVFSVDPPGEFTILTVPFYFVVGLTEYHSIVI
jgi:exoribonuclease R